VEERSYHFKADTSNAAQGKERSHGFSSRELKNYRPHLTYSFRDLRQSCNADQKKKAVRVTRDPSLEDDFLLGQLEWKAEQHQQPQ
jgi:hypothetical protein